MPTKARSVDLRYRTKEVREALERRETVALHVRSKLKGYIVPADEARSEVKVVDHPFFGSRADDQEDVEAVMNRLRAPGAGRRSS